VFYQYTTFSKIEYQFLKIERIPTGTAEQEPYRGFVNTVNTGLAQEPKQLPDKFPGG